MKLVCILALFFLISYECKSADRKYFNAIVSYNHLANISNDPETTPVEYSAHQEIDLDIFLRPSWQFEIISANSIKSDYKFYGFGLRIQTPGVFLSSPSVVSGNKHRVPVDTSVHAELLRMFDQTSPNLSTNYYVSRAGFTLDWMPLKNDKFFLGFDLSTFLIRSDLFIKTSFGLGLEI